MFENFLNRKKESLELQFAKAVTLRHRNRRLVAQKINKMIKKGLSVDKAPVAPNQEGYLGPNWHKGAPPIVMAALNYAVVETLIDNKASIDVKNPDGFTALMLASLAGVLDTVYVLLYNDANPNLQDNKGQTALMKVLSARRNIRPIIKALLDFGADTTLTDKNGDTVVTLAEKMGRKDLADLISTYKPGKKKFLLKTPKSGPQ